MSAQDRLDAAVAAAGDSTPVAAPFVFRIEMGAGRVAALTVPDDTTDTELVQIIAIIAGPGRVQMIAHHSQPASGLVRATSMPRPV